MMRLSSLASVTERFRIRRWLQGATDVIWPPVCMHCGIGTADPDALCTTCWTGLSLIEKPYCERLGTPFAIDYGGSLISPEAMADPPVFQRARAVCHYDAIAQSLVTRLKFSDRLETAKVMAAMMRSAGRDLLRDADLIVPVPLHGWRLLRRGYNQASVLAHLIAEQSKIPVEDGCLSRVKSTRPQVGLTKAERATNVSGAFRVPPEHKGDAIGRSILLIDDVLTTGSTLNAAARVLLRAGASQVDVLTFARVVKGM
jgi:ComF family protein